MAKSAKTHIYTLNIYARARKSEEDNGGKEGKRARKAANGMLRPPGATNRRERARSASTHLAYI